jgi:hypothetical protein
MPEVLVIVAASCGCSAALVDDDGRLVASTVNACRGNWWCECADPACPVLCVHAETLLLELNEL